MGPFAAHTRNRSSRLPSDAGIVLLTTLVKVVLVLGLLGATVYDTISITATHVGVQDDAQAAAQAGHQVLEDRGTAKAAYAAVVAYAEEHGSTVVARSFSIGSRRTVTVTLHRDAPTFVAKYLPRVDTYVSANYTATATDPVR